MRLVIDAERTYENPSEEEITDAVSRIGTGKRPNVLLLYEDHDTYLQATGDARKDLVLEFFDGEMHYEVLGAASRDETAAVFRRFNREEENWDRGLTWETRSSGGGCLGAVVWTALALGASLTGFILAG